MEIKLLLEEKSIIMSEGLILQLGTGARDTQAKGLALYGLAELIT